MNQCKENKDKPNKLKQNLAGVVPRRRGQGPQTVLLVLALTAVAGLTGCWQETDSKLAPTETVLAKSWQETLLVDGEIKAADKTPLSVPGSGWESRILADMVPDGSLVKKGQVIARFDAPRSRLELSQAETELLRKGLAEQAIQAKDASNRAMLGADRAKVEGELAISQRYATAELTLFSRNQLLDALQDVGFLTDKRGYLNWKTGQVQAKSAAEQAVLQSQKQSVSLSANQHRKNLEALELVAPHDGVFLLEPRWDGTKPQIGSTTRPGSEFGALPNTSQLIASFSVEEGRTFGLKPGLALKVRLLGSGQVLDVKISKVGSNASVKSQDSPVKYTDFEASIDAASVQKYQLQPGQAIHGEVSMITQNQVLTVPNIALIQDGAEFAVMLQQGDKSSKQKVTLGARGPVRSEIKSGLSAGAQVLLIPEKKEKKS